MIKEDKNEEAKSPKLSVVHILDKENAEKLAKEVEKAKIHDQNLAFLRATSFRYRLYRETLVENGFTNEEAVDIIIHQGIPAQIGAAQ